MDTYGQRSTDIIFSHQVFCDGEYFLWLSVYLYREHSGCQIKTRTNKGLSRSNQTGISDERKISADATLHQLGNYKTGKMSNILANSKIQKYVKRELSNNWSIFLWFHLSLRVDCGCQNSQLRPENF